MVVGRYLDINDLGAKLPVSSSRLGSAIRCPGMEAFMIGRLVADPGIGPEQWVRVRGPEIPDEQAAKLRDFMAKTPDGAATAWRLAGFI